MRKSERLRLVELELVRIGMQIEIMQTIIDSLMENTIPRASEMESGKWYTRKPLNE